MKWFLITSWVVLGFVSLVLYCDWLLHIPSFPYWDNVMACFAFFGPILGYAFSVFACLTVAMPRVEY